MTFSTSVVFYLGYAAFTVLLVLYLRALKWTWQPSCGLAASGLVASGLAASNPGFGPAIPLAHALAKFLSHLCPRILLLGTLTLWGLRAYFAGWSVVDAWIVAGTVVAWPFMEWLAHAHLLHRHPLQAIGREPPVVITHRAHHQNPWDAKTGLAVPFIIVIYVLGPPLVWLPFFAVPQALTGSAVLTTLLLNYEWLHFLIHTSYKPRSWLYKKLWRNHRLHHFKNEHYWFGVTSVLADALIRSNPSEKTVAHSLTCMDLGIPESMEELVRND
jgi:hypothetical protein